MYVILGHTYKGETFALTASDSYAGTRDLLETFETATYERRVELGIGDMELFELQSVYRNSHFRNLDRL